MGRKINESKEKLKILRQCIADHSLAFIRKYLIEERINAEPNPFVKEILERVWKKNKNVLIVIVGGTGSGKSYTALRLAYELDPTFSHKTLRQRLAYKPDHFFDIVNSGLVKGQAMIIDEGGVAQDAREWHSFNNKAINQILETFRHENLFVIFAVPALKYIDVGARRLFHYYLEALDVDINRRLNKAKIYVFQYNPLLDKTYQKNFHIGSGTEAIKIKRWKIKKVGAKIWHEYEQFSTEQKLEIKKGLKARSEQLKEKDKQKQYKVVDYAEIAKKVLANPEPFIITTRAGKSRIKSTAVCVAFGLKAWQGTMIMEHIERIKRNSNAIGVPA